MSVRLVNQQATAQRKAENARLEQQNDNFKAQVNDAKNTAHKAIDGVRNKAHNIGAELASRINGTFQDAKVDTSRGGDYSKMSTTEVVGDIAKRTAGKAWNGLVEIERQHKKFIYKAGKTVVKAVDSVPTNIAKAAVTVGTYATEKASDAVTGTRQAYNTVTQKAGNIGRALSGAWNAFTNAAALD